MKKLIYLFVMAMLVSGCAITISQVTAPNRNNLLKLSMGMTKDQALSIMGTKPFAAGGFDFMELSYVGSSRTRPAVTINNPYRSEILQGKDKTFEVIYYVTDVKNDNGAIEDDELTPLVFDNGKLIGWGWNFLKDNVQKYEIRVR